MSSVNTDKACGKPRKACSIQLAFEADLTKRFQGKDREECLFSKLDMQTRRRQLHSRKLRNDLLGYFLKKKKKKKMAFAMSNNYFERIILARLHGSDKATLYMVLKNGRETTINRERDSERKASVTADYDRVIHSKQYSALCLF